MITTIAVVALAAILVIRAAAKRGTFQVRRSTRIEAPPEKIWALIDDFHRWASWSPLEDLDPVMRRAYSEPAAGAGAVYAWKSSGRAGVGRMEIAESSPAKVVIHVHRSRTDEVAEFTLRPVEGATEVTWSVTGVGSILERLTTGRHFETGLANLKATVERSWFGPRKPPRRAPRRTPRTNRLLSLRGVAPAHRRSCGNGFGRDVLRQPGILPPPDDAAPRQRYFLEEGIEERGSIHRSRNAERELVGELAVVQHEILPGIELDERCLRWLRRLLRISDGVEGNRKPLRELCF